MKESFPQQAEHRPGPSTGSRQAAQSCGSATSAATRTVARSTAPRRPHRPAATLVASNSPCISPCMGTTLPRRAANLNVPVVVRRPMTPVVFDRDLLRARRARAAALGPSTFLIERAVEDLSDRLATVLRRLDPAVDPRTPTHALRRPRAATRQRR